MSWIKSLFVSDKNIGKLVDAGINAGDKLFYTEEEKAEHLKGMREWYLSLLSSMKPFNVAMRILAIGVFSMWSFHVLAATGAHIAAFFVCEVGQEVCQMSMLGQALEVQMDKHINPHFGLIIMFYFGAAGVNSAIASYKAKN